MAQCQFFLPSKKRQCLNTIATSNDQYCKLHQRLVMDYIDRQISQDGGANLLGDILKSKKLMTSGSKALSSIEKGIEKAEKLHSQTQALSQSLGAITQSVGAGSMNPNYSNPDIINSHPLGSPAVSGNYQRFGDYICIKTTFVEDLRGLLYELFAQRAIVPSVG
jgi:hypothetical protein